MKISNYKRILGYYPGLLSAAEKAAKKSKEKLAQVTAYVTAPVLFCYVSYVIENAEKEGIKKIFFLARDGYILKSIADVMLKSKKSDIETDYLYVSRYALRNAMYFKCDTVQDFESAGFFGHCAVQSAENTLKRAGIDESQRVLVYNKIGFDGDEKRIMDDAEYDDFCKLLKSDKELFSDIKNNSREKYENIIGYFKQSGLFENKRIALVDSGWLGSVQRTLTELIKDNTDTGRITGYYFGLYRKKSERYRSFLFDISDAYRYVPTFCNNLFECFCSAPHGMTVGYHRTENGIQPVTAKVNDYIADAAEIQNDIAVRFAAYACESDAVIPGKKRERLTARLIKALMYKPDMEEAEIYGAFPFCDDATEISVQPLACDSGKSIRNILFLNRISRKRKGQSIYPDKGMFWLYGSIRLTGCKPAWVYRSSVRIWEKLRLIKEKRKQCR